MSNTPAAQAPAVQPPITMRWVLDREAWIVPTLRGEYYRQPYEEFKRDAQAITPADRLSLIALLTYQDSREFVPAVLGENPLTLYHLWRWIRFQEHVFGLPVVALTVEQAATLRDWYGALLTSLAATPAPWEVLADAVRQRRRSPVAELPRLRMSSTRPPSLTPRRHRNGAAA